ncbi:type II toxin-antitoxin system HicB family antitoxin [Desulfuribacillus alkaliarsenatis]|uniref:DNA repair protein n=1 Tax=Desulfuribacillus alkaliarsenatis TaxID=766136 RepID=A0A1E5G0G4_9FIRM|nr:type II toxin-antitoxin system HicB family antitoxin [Desulfuribacillus alkaliarsenatis]OEF95947.1 DNA repair protein [Desulfuribacillus alkaliarsenatis]
MNNLLSYKGYHARVEYSDADEVFFGLILGIEDSISFEADTVIKLKKAFQEAVDDYLEMCEELGKTPDKAYKGSFNVRISPEAHRKADLLAKSKGISLNQFVEKAIKDSMAN